MLPFTAALGLPDRFARRIARNTQLVLLEESNLAKVADPAAGSGGIEDLTDKLCRAAWALFQEIEAAGGAWAALEAGLIQSKVAAVRAEREAAVARRKDALTGTSDFPDLAEAPVAVLDVPPVVPPPVIPAIDVRAAAAHPARRAVRSAARCLRPDAGARPARGRKSSSPISARPADFTARATFAKNFFEAGGIEAVTNDGFESRDEMVAAFKASGAQARLPVLVGRGLCARGGRGRQALRDAGAVGLSRRPAGRGRGRAHAGRRSRLHFRRLRRARRTADNPWSRCQLRIKASRLPSSSTRVITSTTGNRTMSNPERPFGWRKRIGLLSPTVIETAAYDFYRLAPDGVSMCATTSNIEHWSRENFKQHVLDPHRRCGQISRVA